MIPFFTATPDVVSFGTLDRFYSKYNYNYHLHIDTIKNLCVHLDVIDSTFFWQAWDSFVDLNVVTEIPDRFAEVIVTNTGMLFII